MNHQIQLRADGSSILLVHLVYRSPAGTIEASGVPLHNAGDTWKIACVPNMLEAHMSGDHQRSHPWQRTDDPRAVTCPSCRRSPAYARLASILGLPIPPEEPVG